MNKIKIAIVGMGNCASSLIQGIHYYDGKNPDDAIGLMHWDIGGYSPSDIDVVAAFDIDARKVVAVSLGAVHTRTSNLINKKVIINTNKKIVTKA